MSRPARENFKTRALSIADSSGVVRLTLGAPVANPSVDGNTAILGSDAARLQALSLTMLQAINARHRVDG